MNERALRVLEFNKILELLETSALTDGGKDMCRHLKPESDLKAVTHTQAETEEAVILLSHLGGNPLTAFSNVNDALSLAEKGAVLAPGRLLQIASEQTLLDEGFMPLPPVDDRQTQSLRKLINKHLAI